VVEDYNRLIQARIYVVDYFNERVEKTDGYELTLDNTYIVWFSKTLQNWKALVSTHVTDGMYYEITYNGDKKEAYLDAYKKFDNIRIPDQAIDGLKDSEDGVEDTLGDAPEWTL
jgi:Family of unknown function (DUF6275)